MLLISPSAYHRMTFRMQQKDDLVFLANRLAIAGLAFLALAMTGAIMLITDVLFGAVATAVTGALRADDVRRLLGALPLQRRGQPQGGGAAAARSARKSAELIGEAVGERRDRGALAGVVARASPGPLPRPSTFSSSGTVELLADLLALLARRRRAASSRWSACRRRRSPCASGPAASTRAAVLALALLVVARSFRRR